MTFKLLLATSIGLVAATANSASLTTDPTGYTGPKLDLSAYQTGNYNFTFGPVTVGPGLTFTANPGGGAFPLGGNSGRGSVVGQGGYGLASNGTFGGTATYIGVDSGTGYDTITFSTPQTSFGGYFNYAPGVGDDATISTLDAMGNILQSFDIATLAPISTPGGFNLFEFRGIVGGAGESFSGVQFGGNYLLLAGSPSGAISPGVPEAATWAMMIVGFGLVGAAARRRQTLAATA